MRTLLVRPFVDATSGISPPLSLMYLSSYLKSKQRDVRVIDNCVDKRSINDFSVRNPCIQDLVENIKAYDPDIIGMTLFSGELKEVAVLCKILKSELKSVLIVLGGPHPTAMPKQTMEQIPECDFAARGEGELILYDLIAALSNDENLQNIRGISFRLKGENEVYHCEDADIITQLDTLPFPDRGGLIHNYRNNTYSSVVHGMPSDILMTSRGCPFQCSFCFKVCAKYRNRSPENVIKEIDWIIEKYLP